MELYHMTARQFHINAVEKCMKRYEVSHAKATECHPRWVTDTQHFHLCWVFVRNGGQLRREVLDSFTKERRTAILHDFPERHRWYVIPESRAYVGSATIKPTGLEVFAH